MIIKINNMLDPVLFQNEFQQLPMCVQDTIMQRLENLLEAFGNPYLQSGFGGIELYILTETTSGREEIIRKILEFYNLSPDDDLYEYSETVGTNHSQGDVMYKETLYLLSNGEKSILIFCAFG